MKAADTIIKIGSGLKTEKLSFNKDIQYVIQSEDSLSQMLIVIQEAKNVNVMFDDTHDNSFQVIKPYVPKRTLGYRFGGNGKVHVTPTSDEAVFHYAAISLSEYCTGDVYLNTKADTRFTQSSVPPLNSCYFFLGNLSQKSTLIYNIGSSTTSNSIEIRQEELIETVSGQGSLLDFSGFLRTTTNNNYYSYSFTIYGDSNSGRLDFNNTVDVGEILAENALPEPTPAATPEATAKPDEQSQGGNSGIFSGSTLFIIIGVILGVVVIVIVVVAIFYCRKNKNAELTASLLL